MTYAPASLKEVQVYVRAVTGLPWVSLGIIGDKAHDGGYHCGDDRVDSDDYSVDESSRDRNGLTDGSSANDIGKFTLKDGKTLRTFSVWLVNECKKGAPDTRDIREVIYSPDGKTVKRWDRLGVRSSGDRSHLDHTHISWFRDSEKRSKLALFKRYFEGETEEDDMPTADQVAYAVWTFTNEKLTKFDAYEHLRNPEPVKAVLVELKAAKLRQEAILAAVKGVNTAQVIDAVNAAATADAERDAALLTELRDLASGGADADAIVDRIATRLSGGE